MESGHCSMSSEPVREGAGILDSFLGADRLAHPRRPRPKRGDRLDLVPPGARPQCRRGLSCPRQRVRGSLVVDPPTQEVRPRILDGAFDRKVDSAQALDGFDEIIIRERDPVAWVGV